MRIAYFLLPVPHSHEVRYDLSHQEARSRLLRSFGGFTASEVQGAWKAPEGPIIYDKSVKYEVAFEWNSDTRATLAQIATYCGRLARQQCVMICFDDGAVEFSPCGPRMGSPVAPG